MEKLIVFTGLDDFGRVIVEFEDKTKMGSHKRERRAYKVQNNKKGNFITVNKKKYYIDIPEGEWRFPEGKTWGGKEWFPKESL